MRFIGGKSKLLFEIETIINENIRNKDRLIFCDIFSGTGVVGKYFKKDYKIISNDLLYFSYVLQKANIENNNKLTFEKLKKHLQVDNILEYLENVEITEEFKKNNELFIYENYSPTTKSERMYLSNENAMRIDYIRINIETWKNKNIINEEEYYFLLATLIESIPYVSNMSGTYGAFFKHWDNRALKKINLVDLDCFDNKKNNISYNKNSNELIKEICGDILYLDPPYNSRQYLPNYHLLETVALYDKPEIKGVTGIRKYGDKEKSKYCIKKEVLNNFRELIENADFKYIVMSYNNEGIMREEEIEKILKENSSNNSFVKKQINYRKYKSKKDHISEKQLYEILYFIEKG